ncbi:hypothetical protein A2U01_0084458, partial [Trifolium medium]|nr:hypothetical protein [Trifolium medium]
MTVTAVTNPHTVVTKPEVEKIVSGFPVTAVTLIYTAVTTFAEGKISYNSLVSLLFMAIMIIYLN